MHEQEREVKRMQLEVESLERQQDKEREHEMHMQGMMLSFMQQMTDARTFIPPSTYYIKFRE